MMTTYNEIIAETGSIGNSAFADEDVITNSYSGGADWEYSEDGVIEDSGLDDSPNTLYCLFESGYFQGIFNMAGLVGHFTEFENPAFNPVYKHDHWVCSLAKGGE